MINDLRDKGYIYENESALWFNTTQFGDEKDEVVVRSNGLPTYFAADIAYHRNKFQRGFDQVINIWGADHHGHVARMKGAVTALGYDADRLTGDPDAVGSPVQRRGNPQNVQTDRQLHHPGGIDG